jgi:hypothetical protein
VGEEQSWHFRIFSCCHALPNGLWWETFPDADIHAFQVSKTPVKRGLKGRFLGHPQWGWLRYAVFLVVIHQCRRVPGRWPLNHTQSTCQMCGLLVAGEITNHPNQSDEGAPQPSPHTASPTPMLPAVNAATDFPCLFLGNLTYR